MSKLVCIVGMTGAGKSVIADFLFKRGYGFVRFGQITLDLVKTRGLAPTEENERPIREAIRAEHGPGAYATLNIPKFDALLEKGNVVGDGMYSWSEYKILKERYGSRFCVVAVYAPPELRYARLVARTLSASDTNLRHRPATPESAKARDYAEIEKIEKGGPIAMADFTFINTTSIDALLSAVTKTLPKIEKE